MLYRLFKRFKNKSHNIADDSKSMRRISGKVFTTCLFLKKIEKEFGRQEFSITYHIIKF
jgi:hypothetical protein